MPAASTVWPGAARLWLLALLQEAIEETVEMGAGQQGTIQIEIPVDLEDGIDQASATVDVRIRLEPDDLFRGTDSVVMHAESLRPFG